MDMQIYQLVVPAIATYFMVRLLRQFFKNKRTGRSTLIWSIWWGVIMTLSLLPDAVSEQLASILGFADNVHAVIFVAIGLLFLFTFYYSSSIERMQRQITQMVRDQALNDAMREAEKYHYEELLKKYTQKDSDEDSLRA